MRIIVAQDGKVWVCTATDIVSPPGVSVFDGETWKFYTESNGFPVRSVEAIYQTDDGAIWFGANWEGFVRFGTRGLLRYKDGAWLRILREDGMPGDYIHSITQSRDGSLWLTVPKVGVVRYRPDFTDLGTVSGSVTRPDGSPWAGVGIRVEDKAGQARAGTMTGADGRYQVWVSPGSYRVSVADAKGVDPVEVTPKAGEQVDNIDFAPTAVGPPIPTWPFTTALGVLGLGILACLIPLVRRRERLGGILLSPGTTLQQVVGQPDWVGPFFLVLVSALVISMTKIGWMLPVMGGSGRGMPGSMRLVMTIVVPLFMMAGILVFSYGAWLARVGLIWLLARISGERVRLYPLLSVVGYAKLPEMLLGGIVMACAFSLGLAESSCHWPITTVTSLGSLFPNLAAGPLRILLGAIELFGLWSLVLTIVGVQRVYGFPMRKAAFIVILYWILAVGAIIGFGAIVGVITKMMSGG